MPAFMLTPYDWRLFLFMLVCTRCTMSWRMGDTRTSGSGSVPTVLLSSVAENTDTTGRAAMLNAREECPKKSCPGVRTNPAFILYESEGSPQSSVNGEKQGDHPAYWRAQRAELDGALLAWPV